MFKFNIDRQLKIHSVASKSSVSGTLKQDGGGNETFCLCITTGVRSTNK